MIVAGLTLALGLGLYLLLNPFRPDNRQSLNVPHVAAEVKLQTPAEDAPGLPVRLRIPKIKVDAALDYVRLVAGGDLAAPDGPETAAWYFSGPRPGEEGSSVISGHFGYKDNIPGVFDNLHKLRKGDNIYVEDDRGRTVAFVVSGFETYDPNDDAADVFSSDDGRAHLNLITCKGDWIPARNSYSQRLVVFTEKES